MQLAFMQALWDRQPATVAELRGELAGLGRAAEAADARARFEKAWSRATVTIPGSCFCKGA